MRSHKSNFMRQMTVVKNTLLLLIVLALMPSLLSAAQFSDTPVYVRWSPDGQYIGLSRANTLTIIDAASYQVLNTIPEVSHVRDFAWSPDGTRLAAFAQSGKALNIWEHPWDAEQIRLISSFDFEGGTGFGIAWKPDGTQIALGRGEVVRIIDVETGQLLHQVTGDSGGFVHDVAWSLDDRLALTTVRNYTIVFNTTTWEMINLFLNLRWDDSTTNVALVFSPDTQKLAIGTTTGGILIWGDTRQDPAPNFQPERIFGTDGRVEELRWEPSGLVLASAHSDGTIMVWTPADGAVVAQVTAPEGSELTSLDWSPYGGQLVFAGNFTGDVATTNSVTQQQADFFRVLIPAPTFDRLNAIAEMCVRDAPTPSRTVTGLASQPVTSLDALPDFVAQVEALPADAIPAACRADLLAVAGAIIARGE